MSDPKPVLYGDEEVALLLRRAIELERELPGPQERAGFTLAELRQIGAEVGIPSGIVDEAANQIGMDKRGLWERIIRTPTRFFDQRTLSGELTPEQVASLIGALRRLTQRQGEVEEVLGAVEWKTDSEFAPLHVRIQSGGGRTRIEALENRRGESGFAVGLVGPGGGLLFGTALAGLAELGPGWASLGIVLGTAAATSGLVWHWWRGSVGRARKRMDYLMTHLGSEANRMVRGEPLLPDGPQTDPLPDWQTSMTEQGQGADEPSDR